MRWNDGTKTDEKEKKDGEKKSSPEKEGISNCEREPLFDKKRQKG